MKAGNVKEFIYNLTIQDEMVRYKDKLYYFYGIRYDSERDIYYTSIDKFGTDIYHFEEEFYCYGLEHLPSDPYWEKYKFLFVGVK